jgi:hypothetical protein
MLSSKETSKGALRRTAASASLAASAVGFAWASTSEHDFFSLRWGLIGMTALTGGAAVALLRRGVLPQVLARGVAWVVCLPALAGVLGSLLYGRFPDAGASGFAVSTGAALLLSWPNLHTDDARREFAPVAYRRTFLAGAVASAAAGTVAALGGLGNLIWGQPGEGLPLAALAAVMLATTVGVVRMRAWGVLLGMITALAMLVEMMLHLHDFTTWGFAVAALPGLILAAPLLVSRLLPEKPANTANAGGVVRTRAPQASLPVRIRVEELPEEDAGAPASPEALAARAE